MYIVTDPFYVEFSLIKFRELSKTATSSPQSFPTARDIYEIDTDHANIINDVKVNYAEQEILYKKIKNRNVSFDDQQ